MCDKEERKALWGCIALLLERVEHAYICGLGHGYGDSQEQFFYDGLKKIKETISHNIASMLVKAENFESETKALADVYPELFSLIDKEDLEKYLEK